MIDAPDATPDADSTTGPTDTDAHDATSARVTEPRPQLQFVRADVFVADLPAHSFTLVYADPPYASCRFEYARRNRSRQWGRSARGDFTRELIARMESLRAETGVCAVSMSSPELRLLHLFPSTVRVMAWVKPYAPQRPQVWPTYAWEPLVVWGALPGRLEQRAVPRTPHDWLSVAPKVPRGSGHETPKPLAFAEWVLSVTLGPRVGPVCELFAGTAPVARLAIERGCEAVAVDVNDYLNAVG
jgi:hypothetical protein